MKCNRNMISWVWIVCLMTLSLPEMLFAQADTSPARPTEPYLATVTGEQVYVRSGSAQSYYPSAYISKGQIVIVRDQVNGWAKIDPTPNCFSYIYKKYVDLRDYDFSFEPVPNAVLGQEETFRVVTDAPLGHETVAGIVNADRVRVRAGSLKVHPIQANQIQGFKNKGDEVQIIGAMDDYYKIVCPKGAHFWVSADYLKKQGPLTPQLEQEMTAQTSMVALNGVEADLPTDEAVAQYRRDRQEYRDVAELLEEQKELPLNQQDLQPLRDRVEKLIAETGHDQIRSSAQLLERQVMRLEMAKQIWLDTQKQDQRLAQTLAGIDEQIQAAVATQPSDLAGQNEIVVKGRIARSAVFTAEKGNPRFLVLNEMEQITHYAVASNAQTDLGLYVGRDVTLIGKARYDAYSGIRILTVTSVVENGN